MTNALMIREFVSSIDLPTMENVWSPERSECHKTRF